MTDAALEALSTDDLRERAMSVALHRADVKFLWSVLTHLDTVGGASTEGGSAGEIGGSVTDLINAVQQISGRADLGESEPLLRAKFIDYLSQHR